MILPAIFLCQVLGTQPSFDPVEIDEAALRRAINGELKDKGRAKIRSLGGYSCAAFPVYLKWLDEDPPLSWQITSRVLLMVRESEGDKSIFRSHAVKLLTHEEISVSDNAILLLEQIGTAEDAAAVATQLKRETNDIAYFDSILATLSAIGTEAEIGALEKQRAAGWLKDHPRFWERVGECDKAIRDRAAKKEKDMKAAPPDKK